MVGHSYQGIVRTFREPKFAHANEGPILQARLSKDSGLRPAMLTLPAQLCYLRVNANLRAWQERQIPNYIVLESLVPAISKENFAF